MRTLLLASGGFMKGSDVLLVQRALKTKLKNTMALDGEYGPATAAAVAVWKRFHAGYPENMLANGRAQGLGPDGQKMLLGKMKIPAGWLLRAKVRRAAQPKPQVPMGTRALDHAAGFVGLTEVPANSNKVPKLQAEGQRLKGVGWISAMGYAWCAYFVNLMYLAVGGKTAIDGLRNYKFNVLYCPTILSLALDGKFGMRVVGWSEIQPGDALIHNFAGGDPRADHISMARAKPTGDYVPTREGNTSAGESGSQSNGGMVADRSRHRNTVTAAIRFNNNY